MFFKQLEPAETHYFAVTGVLTAFSHHGGPPASKAISLFLWEESHKHFLKRKSTLYLEMETIQCTIMKGCKIFGNSNMKTSPLVSGFIDITEHNNV